MSYYRSDLTGFHCLKLKITYDLLFSNVSPSVYFVVILIKVIHILRLNITLKPNLSIWLKNHIMSIWKCNFFSCETLLKI